MHDVVARVVDVSDSLPVIAVARRVPVVKAEQMPFGRLRMIDQMGCEQPPQGNRINRDR